MEKNVLMVTSRQPNRAKILTMISCHRRWGRNIRVRQSLILNPFTPPIISVLSLITTSRQNLKDIKNDGKLHPLLRDIAEVILSHKESEEEI
jgi:hypothetical protein